MIVYVTKWTDNYGDPQMLIFEEKELADLFKQRMTRMPVEVAPHSTVIDLTDAMSIVINEGMM